MADRTTLETTRDEHRDMWEAINKLKGATTRVTVEKTALVHLLADHVKMLEFAKDFMKGEF